MDFFGAQDDARRKTWQLALLFGAAVLCLVLLTNLLIAAVYAWTARPGPTGGLDLNASLADLPVSFWGLVSLAVVAMVGLASGYKFLRIRGGGRTVAEALGGRLVAPATADYRQRRLLNVVEEMAIASGTPVPPVYLVDEPSINAFAAGFGPDDAVIGVNQGTLNHLDRDELQGVIAHEFSHILNGDSRLNLRLVAILHGILFLGLVGRALLRGMGRGSHRRGRSSSGGAPGLALGLGLLVIGYAGTFFGNLIKAAVSRQREYLADAASVQFTRNPGGIAGALKKIGGLSEGSRMSGAAAAEASHMFFGQAGKMFLTGLMSTHPPLDKRIRAVDPRWDGSYPVLTADGSDAGSPESEAAAAFAAATPVAAGSADVLEIHATPDEVVAAVGRLDQTGLGRARTLIGGLPERLHAAAHQPFEARALVHALVLDDGATRARQHGHLREHAEPGMAEAVGRLAADVEACDPQQRLTLLELSVPALKTLSAQQYHAFVTNLVALIRADRRIDLLEWVLHRLLVKELKPHFEGQRPPRVRYRRIERLAGEAAELLGALAREAADPADAPAAFEAGWRALGLSDEPPALRQEPDADFGRLNHALAELRCLQPLKKPRLIKACAATALADHQVSVRQAVLLQGIAATLDCPLPPTIKNRAPASPDAA